MQYQRPVGAINDAVTPGGRRMVLRVHQYDAIVDLMLSEPTITNSEIARRLGRTPAWMTWITHSDAFKDHYEKRRREKNALVHQGLADQLASVAKQGLDRMEDILKNNPKSVNLASALEVVDTTLERLGYGVQVKEPAAAAPSVTNVIQLSADDFRAVHGVLRSHEETTVVDVTPEAAVPPAPSNVAIPVGVHGGGYVAVSSPRAKVAIPRGAEKLITIDEDLDVAPEKMDDDVPVVMGSEN